MAMSNQHIYDVMYLDFRPSVSAEVGSRLRLARSQTNTKFQMRSITVHHRERGYCLCPTFSSEVDGRNQAMIIPELCAYRKGACRTETICRPISHAWWHDKYINHVRQDQATLWQRARGAVTVDVYNRSTPTLSGVVSF